MTAEPTLHLYAACLLSKWGFNDGDKPDALLDYLDERNMDYPSDWRRVLELLVRERLVPVLDQTVEVEFIETIHNPIRAVTVDGADVTDQWYEAHPTVQLTPEGVAVPLADVLDAMNRVAAAA